MPRPVLRSIPVFVSCLLLAALPAVAEDPAPSKAAPAPAFELSVGFGPKSSAPHRVGYGGPVHVHVSFRNRTSTPQTLFWDRRSDGVLRVTFEGEDGIVWKPHQTVSAAAPPLPHPVLVTHGSWTTLSQPTPARVLPGHTFEATMTFRAFTLASPPPQGYEGRLIRELPPGRYLVRAHYAKPDATVPLGPPRWNTRLIQLRPTQEVRIWPGLFTGTLDARGRLEVTAPRRTDVDALKERLRALEARNKALQKQLDAIREILRKP